ncbi:MAG: hypothetical protein MK183_12005 [Verrucomicrobiales bacterium]|nr:hypothetical protein [Verrucomicrobiales bacterium]
MKIRNIAAGCALLLAVSPAIAGDHASGVDSGEPFSLGADISLGYDTDYVFRGVASQEDLLTTTLNLNTISLGDGIDLDLGAWYANTYNGDYTELNLFGGVSMDLGGASLSAGITYYTSDTDGFDIVEPYVGIGTELAGLDVSLGYAYDSDDDSAYISLGAGKSLELSDDITVDLSAALNYADDYYGRDGFNNIDLRVGLPIAVGGATLTPYVAGSIAVDGLDDAGGDDELFGGVSLSLSF